MAKRLYGVDPIERFNQKYIVNPKTGCWEWTDYIDKYGYGKFTNSERKKVLAHRFSFLYFKGSLDNNLKICHNCNNTKCVNPDHLRQDSHSSNMIDKLYCHTHHNQLLSVDEVIQIKKALQNYYRGQIKDLAHFYKVDKRVISSIKNERSWNHINI